MNPCPCGYYGDPEHECECTTQMIQNYQKKLSGPLLDRIDLFVHVARVPRHELTAPTHTDTTDTNNWRQAISHARQTAVSRQGYANAGLTSRQLQKTNSFSPEAKQLLDIASDKLKLSARSYFKVMRVAITIADLEQSDIVKSNHVAEALQFRHQ